MTRRFSWILATLTGGLVALLGCMRATASAEGVPVVSGRATPPRLVVFITVDQFRGDFPVRFGSELKYGMARLTRGAWFVRAFQDHAITETAPGHASVMSGRFPRSTGIISNSIGVNDANYQLLTGLPTEAGASPERFRGTTLFDWLYAKDRRSRAVSVSMKDRGAILPIGRSRQDIYWYSGNGSFTTSTYYRDTLPAWVREFNARRLPYGYAGAEWRLSREPATYPEPDSVSFENRGRDNVFPHQFPYDTLGAASYIRVTPSMDSLTALFALEGLRQTGIGHGPQTDILAISFSAADYIGHAYGPDSREAHENVLRLDETLGWFLDSLYKQRDSASVVIALTGDHGVQPIPELARERGEATGDQGMRVSLRRQVADVREGLRAANVDTEALLYDGELVALDRSLINKTRLSPDSILNAFRRAALQVRGVARIDRLSTIRRADFALDPIARRWAHQVPDDAKIDLVITLTKYSFWGSGSVAAHGSPYDQDAHVPIFFYGAGVRPGHYETFARTVDMGPTLAAIIGVLPTQRVDGLVLTQAVVR